MFDTDSTINKSFDPIIPPPLFEPLNYHLTPKYIDSMLCAVPIEVPIKVFGTQSTTISYISTKQESDNIRTKIHEGEWASWTCLALCLIYVIAATIAKGSISKIINNYFTLKLYKSYEKNTSVIYSQALSAITLMSIVSLSAFGLVIVSYGQTNINTLFAIKLYIISLSLVIAFIILKNIAIRFFCFMLEKRRARTALFHEELLTLAVSGLFSSPFIIIALICPSKNLILQIILPFLPIVVIGVVKFLKIITIFMSEKVSVFFTILYLCALEIAPIWLIIDFIQNLK